MKEFKDLIGSKFNDLADIVYCYQDLNHLPNGFECPPEREKPWGTGHALLSTIDTIKSRVKVKTLIIHSSRPTIPIILSESNLVLEMEIRIAINSPTNLPNSSINPLLNPL